MNEVVFEYQLTFEECRRIVLGASPKTNRAIAVILVGIVVIGAGGAIASHEWIGALATVAFIAFCLVTRFWIASRRFWNSALGIQEPRTVTFNEEGIVSKSESVELKYPWSQFSSAKETEEFFVLLTPRSGRAIAIPKRGLVSAEDEVRFRSMLESHAPVTYGDQIIRRSLAIRLLLLSVAVILITVVYVVVRVN
jgi:hypothetical protein